MENIKSPAAQLADLTIALKNLSKYIEANPDSLHEPLERLITKAYKVLPSSHNKLLDIVAYKKINGKPNYTQTEALATAIDMLHKTENPPKRSKEFREQEETRSKIIKAARKRTKQKIDQALQGTPTLGL